jgi:lysophospholipase L1-like esterase
MNIFPHNARVCFLGDSITHNNEYVSRICAHYHDNLPERKVKFFNGGTSGGSIRTLLANFDRDVIPHSPTHAVIMIGINDSWRNALNGYQRGSYRYSRLKEAFGNYKNNLATICEKLEELGVKITLCTPTPYDEYQVSETPALRGGFALIAEYASHVRNFAKEIGYGLCDFHAYISEVAQSENVICTDRVHPTSLGHYHMAKCFMEYQGENIGEYAPIPDYLDKWKTVVEQLRNIRATEHLIIHDYSLSTQEKLEKAKEYIEGKGKEAPREAFVLRATQYLNDKPMQDKLEQQANELMDLLYSK